MRSLFLSLLVTLATLLAAHPARAQGNDFAAPTGGRTALMGNTGVALGEDGASPFINPATIVRIKDTHLAFSVNFFTLAFTHYSGWHQPGAVDPRFGNLSLDGTGISSSTFNTLPSTLCLFFTLADFGMPNADGDIQRWAKGRQKLAICIGSTESEDVSTPALAFQGTTPTGVTAQAESMFHKWGRLHVGPSFSQQISDQAAVGLSLHGVYTTDSYALAGGALSNGATGPLGSSLGVSGDGHSLDLVALLGGTYQIEHLTLGASVQLPALHVFGSYGGTMNQQETGDAGAIVSASGSFRAPPPPRFSLGLGGSWRRVLFEVDTSYDFPDSSAYRSDVALTTTTLAGGVLTTATSNASYGVRSSPTWNISGGAEYFVSQGLSLIGGLGTSISSLPPLAPVVSPGNLVQARENKALVSIGIGSYGDAGELLLGFQLGYGWGQALAVNPYELPNTVAAVDTQEYSALFVLAGATSLGTIKRAVEKVEDMMTNRVPDQSAPLSNGPPAPTPAPKVPPANALPQTAPTPPAPANEPSPKP